MKSRHQNLEGSKESILKRTGQNNMQDLFQATDGQTLVAQENDDRNDISFSCRQDRTQT